MPPYLKYEMRNMEGRNRKRMGAHYRLQIVAIGEHCSYLEAHRSEIPTLKVGKSSLRLENGTNFRLSENNFRDRRKAFDSKTPALNKPFRLLRIFLKGRRIQKVELQGLLVALY
jgi:hypothetical protein